MSSSDQPMAVFINRLKMIADLPDEAGEALERIPAVIKTFAANEDIARQGDTPAHCCVILKGWICRNKMLESGKRQITALHFAGVAPDLQSLFIPEMDHNITALTSVRAAFIPHDKLREVIDQLPGLAAALWQDTVVDAAISREWEVNLGARPAAQRIAHVFCELGIRLERFGLAERDGNALSFEWPLTQMQLADATGLSTVHVNRSLQALRGSGLIEYPRGTMTINHLPKLEEFSGFNRDYLQAEQPRSDAKSEFGGTNTSPTGYF
jgi:CRP-like cAMP-binding protein